LDRSKAFELAISRLLVLWKHPDNLVLSWGAVNPLLLCNDAKKTSKRMAMRTFAGILLLALVSLIACGKGDTVVSSVDERNKIEVVGVATIRTMPDIALVQMGVRTQEEDAGEALASNNEESAALLAGLKQEGIAEEDVQTVHFWVWSDYNSKGVRTKTEVTNGISVKVRDLTRLGEILGAALATGIHVFVDNVEFGLENKGPIKQELRIRAVEDARLRAEKLAEGAGKQLGEMLQIKEVEFQPWFGGPQPTSATVETATSGGGDVPIELGPLEVGILVEVIFEIR